jgi:hypothetical protein
MKKIPIPLCPKCKKQMIRTYIHTWMTDTPFTICNNKDCSFYGILRRTEEDNK